MCTNLFVHVRLSVSSCAQTSHCHVSSCCKTALCFHAYITPVGFNSNFQGNSPEFPSLKGNSTDFHQNQRTSHGLYFLACKKQLYDVFCGSGEICKKNNPVDIVRGYLALGLETINGNPVSQRDGVEFERFGSLPGVLLLIKRRYQVALWGM